MVNKGTFQTDKPSGVFSSSDYRNLFQSLFQGDRNSLRARAQSTPDMTISIDGSVCETYYKQIAFDSVASTFTSMSTSVMETPTNNPRIDLISLDSGANLTITQGDEAVSPTAPSCPDGELPICKVYHKPTEVSIVDYEDRDNNPNEGYIYRDTRPFLKIPTGMMKLTGAQTIAGVKTFLEIMNLPASTPTSDNELIRKAYIDNTTIDYDDTRYVVGMTTYDLSLGDGNQFINIGFLPTRLVFIASIDSTQAISFGVDDFTTKRFCIFSIPTGQHYFESDKYLGYNESIFLRDPDESGAAVRAHAITYVGATFRISWNVFSGSISYTAKVGYLAIR